MDIFLARCFLWIIFGLKLLFLLIGVACICALVESIFKKKLYLLYILLEIAAFVLGFRAAASAIDEVEDAINPCLALVGVVFDIAVISLILTHLFGKQDSTDNNLSNQKQDSDGYSENGNLTDSEK